MRSIYTTVVGAAALACASGVSGQAVCGPRILAPNTTSGQDFVTNKACTAKPPFLHWDLREFPGCNVPWVLGTGAVPDLDGMGGPNTAADRGLAQTAFANSFAAWSGVTPSLIGFTNAAVGAAPATSGLALDGHNTLHFGNSGLDDVQVVPPNDDFVRFVAGVGNVIDSGPDQMLASTVVPDDMMVMAAGRPFILPGANGVLNSVANNLSAVAAGGNVVTRGVNMVLESQPQGDDIVNAAGNIVDGGNLIAESTANNQGAVGLGLTGLFFNNTSGVIMESDITFGAGANWVVNPATNGGGGAGAAINLQGVATHEIGHFIGVAHPANVNPMVVDPADGVTPTMFGFVFPPSTNNNFNQTLHPCDAESCNFLYTQDLGDAADPWRGVFNEYQSLVQSPAAGRTLNGIALRQTALGPLHLLGYSGDAEAAPPGGGGAVEYPFYFECLGPNMGRTGNPSAEHESNQVDADAFDDGVFLPNPLQRGALNRVLVRVTHSNQAGRYMAGNRSMEIHFNGYFDFPDDCVFDPIDLEIWWSGVPGTTSLASPNLVAAIFLPNNVFLAYDVWVPFTAGDDFGCRFRVDYGEDEGRVQRFDPSLAPAVGVSQFGEVEDYMCSAEGFFIPPCADSCFDAINTGDTIGLGAPVVIGDLSFATSELGDVDSCAFNNNRDWWYRFIPPVTCPYRIDTCGSNFDTVLSVWDDCPFTGNEIACNDDDCGLQSVVTPTLNAGQIYMIRISGYNDAVGTYRLNIFKEPVTGACCFFDGTCAEVTPSECFTGGNYLGDGTTCSSVTCLGACCFSDGSCADLLDESGCLGGGGTWQGPNTDCFTSQCYELTGACCLSDGTCFDGLFESDCVYNGGIWQGPFQTCQDAVCGVPGACCLPDGYCVDSSTQSDCEFIDGLYQGDGTNCSTTFCFTEFGACCFPNGACAAVLTESECELGGGIYQGTGTDCTILCLPADSGACCFSDGSCVDLTTLFDCENSGGTYQGDFSDCLTTVCAIPLQGACCLSDGSCMDVLSQTECEILFGGMYQGDGTDCSTVFCMPLNLGACCLSDGSCTDFITQPDCEFEFGGIYQGDGTTCLNVFCNPGNQGACCLPDGGCIDFITQPDCEFEFGGVYQGDGTTCLNVFCDFVGACCFENGTCIDFISFDECEFYLGGFYQGDGSDCTTVFCPALDVGACCFPDGSCIDFVSQQDCEFTQGGVYQGDGTDCGIIFCEPPTGACCLQDANCVDTTQFDCEFQLLGLYMGDGTDCASTICGGACCLPDGNCIQTFDQFQCDLLNGLYQGDGLACSQVNCPLGACCLPGGACVDFITEFECVVNLQGDYQGDFTDCTSTDCGCLCECDGVSGVNILDLLCFLSLWFPLDPGADINNDGVVDILDLLDFLSCWFPSNASGECTG